MPTQAPEPPGGAPRLDSFVCSSACYFSLLHVQFPHISRELCHVRSVSGLPSLSNISSSFLSQSVSANWLIPVPTLLPARGAPDLFLKVFACSQLVELPTWRDGADLAAYPARGASDVFPEACSCSQHMELPTWLEASAAGADPGRISRGICMLPARGASDLAR